MISELAYRFGVFLVAGFFGLIPWGLARPGTGWLPFFVGAGALALAAEWYTSQPSGTR